MLRDLSYKGVYKSDLDNILEDFYFPALSVANSYDRAVGFFSASTISHAAQALSVFVKRGGMIRLILGAFSDAQDLEAVKQGYREKEISEKIGNELLAMIANVSDELFQNRFDTLSWLVAHGRLDVSPSTSSGHGCPNKPNSSIHTSTASRGSGTTKATRRPSSTSQRPLRKS